MLNSIKDQNLLSIAIIKILNLKFEGVLRSAFESLGLQF